MSAKLGIDTKRGAGKIVNDLEREFDVAISEKTVGSLLTMREMAHAARSLRDDA